MPAPWSRASSRASSHCGQRGWWRARPSRCEGSTLRAPAAPSSARARGSRGTRRRGASSAKAGGWGSGSTEDSRGPGTGGAPGKATGKVMGKAVAKAAAGSGSHHRRPRRSHRRGRERKEKACRWKMGRRLRGFTVHRVQAFVFPFRFVVRNGDFRVFSAGGPNIS